MGRCKLPQTYCMIILYVACMCAPSLYHNLLVQFTCWPNKASPTIHQAIGDSPTARPVLDCLLASTSESFRESIVGGIRLSSSCLCPVSRSHSWNLISTNSLNCCFCSLQNTKENSVRREQPKERNYGAEKRIWLNIAIKKQIQTTLVLITQHPMMNFLLIPLLSGSW